MTKISAYFLANLKAFLDAQPVSKRKELQKLHQELAEGKKLHRTHLSRHLNLHATPNMDTTIVYLQFAKDNGVILHRPGNRELFSYGNEKDRAAAGKTKGKNRG